MRAYEELSARWDLDQADSEFMMNTLNELLKKTTLHWIDPTPRRAGGRGGTKALPGADRAAGAVHGVRSTGSRGFGY